MQHKGIDPIIAYVDTLGDFAVINQLSQRHWASLQQQENVRIAGPLHCPLRKNPKVNNGKT